MEAREIRRPSLAFTVCSEATHAGRVFMSSKLTYLNFMMLTLISTIRELKLMSERSLEI